MAEEEPTGGQGAAKPPKRPRRGATKTAAEGPAGGGEVVAITGADGFFGSNVLNYLRSSERFAKIVVIDLRKPALAIRKTVFYKTDLTEPNCDARIADIFERESVARVVHCGFTSWPRVGNNELHEFEVIGTLNLLNACARRKVAQIVVPSTTKVYGAHPKNPNFLTEEMELRGVPDFPYIQNRIEVEGLLAKHRKSYPGTAVTVLRFATVLGPRARTYETRFFSRPVIPSVMGYDPLLQFVHEDDAIDAFQLAIDKAEPGVFNIVGRGVLPLSTLCKIGGKFALPLPWFAVRSMLGSAWLAGAGGLPPAYLRYLQFLCVADGELAKQRLGFTARHSTKETWLAFNGEERLRRYVEAA